MNLKALIIDDEIDICVLLAGLLKKMGISAIFAISLEEGIKSLSENDVNVLFLDNNLPDGSGLEHLKEIKNQYPRLIIFMISAFDGENERKFALENGASEFIGKPLSGTIVKSALSKHFEKIGL